MYNYGYSGIPNYNGFINPYANQMQPQVQNPTRSEIVRVNGENGARAFQLAPNSSALLLDESAPLVWLVQSDGAGYKTVTPYSIAPYQQPQPVDTKSLEARISRLEELVNVKSDSSGSQQSANSDTEH